ncbi:hypothetical protein AX15_004337 [Amanita polypyramis BW_CC]|nr:hypothetical protein AX15_004337 [Amanita polypyramis BW_CC]
MCHTSPASYLVWATFSSGLLVFLFYHLWSFDRFKCLKWDSGPNSGAFKRVMTYSYLLSVPLMWLHAMGFTIIKYRAGFIFLPGTGDTTVIPTPYTLWEPAAQAAIFPLIFLFSISWALEIVTHLEELCFWYFLLNAGQMQRDWFKTWYFRLWVTGSVTAILAFPLMVIFTRLDPFKCEAYLFLVGSLGSLCITLLFLPILWTFPAFLDSLRSEDVDTATIARLTKFSELNKIRVALRFLFVLPFLCLGIDGVRSNRVVNLNLIATDVLAAVAALGCVMSSGITLVIFFPRSVEREIAERDAARLRKMSRFRRETNSVIEDHEWIKSAPGYAMTGGGASPIKKNVEQLERDRDSHNTSPDSIEKPWIYGESEISFQQVEHLPPLRPNRRRGTNVEPGGPAILSISTPSNSSSNLHYSVHPMVLNWTSPIEFEYSNNRLTFRRP